MGCANSKADTVVEGKSPRDLVKPVETEAVVLDDKKDATRKAAKAADAGRRAGVSAEATAAGHGAYTKVVHEKSDEARARIAAATASSALFSGLDDSQRADIVDAMFEVKCAANTDVIIQGDVGDNFYVVDSGEYQAWIKQVPNKPVKEYVAGVDGTFGELALM